MYFYSLDNYPDEAGGVPMKREYMCGVVLGVGERYLSQTYLRLYVVSIHIAEQY